MIPKVIHYCWFGRNPLPQTARKCIESWRKFCPGYEIKEWNEDNFDIAQCRYARQAYESKKYAFTSDYARFWILYNYGGLYFDTDVELIQPIDDIIAKGAFMGCEHDAAQESDASALGVAPGLGLGVNPGLGLYREILNRYESIDFLGVDGKPDTKENVVTITTDILVRHGLRNTPEIQEVAGVYVYPRDYFAPKDIDTKKLTITPNTRSIHHYDGSWVDRRTNIITWFILTSRRLIGRRGSDFIISTAQTVKHRILRR